ncbi:MAG: 2-oxoacid:ferredoxin oxidoreductase subunit beta [Proteobacteria bacterium]|nr:2-oxoacid:ferredoxin oxidoreductase subunit beta [Pseudomonadota bacterium]
MVTLNDYGEFETAWCPGCGDHQILEAVKQALVNQNLSPHEVLFVSGIGQAAKAPHYLRANVFNGLHGRALPAATGAKLANPGLKVIVESGDGCSYGEGGNHFLAALRRNIDVTMLVHDNQVYGLTKGQASPTSPDGFVTKAQPFGVFNRPFNPVAVAVGMRAGFVARGFSGMVDLLAELIEAGMKYKGLALIDILQPCVSFNKVNTFAWYKKRCQVLPDDYDPADWSKAMHEAYEWGDRIPVGVIYRDDNLIPLESRLPGLIDGPLVGRGVDLQALQEAMDGFA